MRQSKIIIILFVFVSLAFLVGGEGSDSTRNDEWTMFGRYLNHSGYINSSVSANISKVDVYTYTISTNQLRGIPVIAGGYVYVGSDNKQLYQLNATNVSILVANYTMADSADFVSPVFLNGYVYMASGGSIAGQLYQLNATNVSILVANYTLYKEDISAKTRSIAVLGDNVYVSSKNGTSANVHQLNATNVTNLISVYIGSANTPVGGISLSGKNLYVALGNTFYQLNSTNVSRVINSFVHGSLGEQFPPLRDDYVYLVHDLGVYQLNATNVSLIVGNNTGTFDFASSSPSLGVAVNDEYLFVSDTTSTGFLVQFNATNVTIGPITSYTTGGGALVSSPVIAGGAVFIGSENSKLYRFGNYTLSDLNAPSITINFPGNVTYNASSLNFNVSLNENGTAWFTLNGGNKNYTLLNSLDGSSIFGSLMNYTNASMVNGGYNFTAYGNDTAGNRADIESVRFGYDSARPAVTINLPTSATKTTDSFAINITLNEKGSCQYSINGGSANTSLTDSGDNKDFTATRTSVSNAAYVLSAYCIDLTGNRNYTESVSFSVSVASTDSGASSGGSGGGTIPSERSKTEKDVTCKIGECSSWSACDYTKKRKTRTCSLSGISCTEKEKIEVSACGVGVCVSDWNCGDWSSPVEGKTYRKCIDNNQCALKRRLGVAL
ncbi:MAG: PQQ-binding-like beta-propeller repeat protein [Nanoarchaeota archaeon]